MNTTRRSFLKSSGSGLAAILATSTAPSLLSGAHHASQKKLGEQLEKKEKLNISPQELMEQQENANRLGGQVAMLKQQIGSKT